MFNGTWYSSLADIERSHSVFGPHIPQWPSCFVQGTEETKQRKAIDQLTTSTPQGGSVSFNHLQVVHHIFTLSEKK